MVLLDHFAQPPHRQTPATAPREEPDQVSAVDPVRRKVRAGQVIEDDLEEGGDSDHEHDRLARPPILMLTHEMD